MKVLGLNGGVGCLGGYGVLQLWMVLVGPVLGMFQLLVEFGSAGSV